MNYLIIMRHAESEWNARNVFTGITDVSLSEKGKEQVKQKTGFIKNLKIEHVYTSTMKRTKETLAEIEKNLNLTFVSKHESSLLNERDYGIYTEKSKEEIKQLFGEERYKIFRRSWDYPIEGGESLKTVSERVIPYFKEEIESKIQNGQNVMIVAHGNSLRPIMKYVENISEEEIINTEITPCEIIVYTFNQNKLTNKQCLI